MLGIGVPSRSPLRLTSFRNFWGALLVSRLGDQFTIIALLWYVLQLTGSGIALGTVLLCFSLPAVLTSSVFGSLLDRLQPRDVMCFDNAGRALLIGAIPALHAVGLLQLWMVYLLSLLAGALSPATLVGVRVTLPHLVPDDQLENANALLDITANLPVLIGPAIAGVLVGIFGAPPMMIVDAVSFVFLAGVLYFMPDVPVRSQIHGERRGNSWLGFRELMALKEVRVITALSLVFFLAYWPLEPALPIYSRDVLRAGASGFGLLWSGFGVGALLGLLTIRWLRGWPRPGVIFATIAILWGLLLLPLVFLPSLVTAMVFLALAGCVWGPYNTIETSLLQRLVPAHQRGQVFGARSALASATGPVGLLIGGALLDRLSSSNVIGLSALACVVVGVVGLSTPSLRNLKVSDR